MTDSTGRTRPSDEDQDPGHRRVASFAHSNHNASRKPARARAARSEAVDAILLIEGPPSCSVLQDTFGAELDAAVGELAVYVLERRPQRTQLMHPEAARCDVAQQ